MTIEIGFRWTRGTVWIPSKRGDHGDGAGVQASYYTLKGADRPPLSFGIPEGLPIGLKVYRGGFNARNRTTRDAAYAMQEKLSRQLLAPKVFGCWKVFSVNPERVTEAFGWGFITEHIELKAWGKPEFGNPDQRQASVFLRMRLPGIGDMHGGNFGWNPRLKLPQLLDMGDHGIKGLSWRKGRVPSMTKLGDKLTKEREEKENRRAVAHARRKGRGEAKCRTCQATL